jgi:hypothetical protein
LNRQATKEFKGRRTAKAQRRKERLFSREENSLEKHVGFCIQLSLRLCAFAIRNSFLASLRLCALAVQNSFFAPLRLGGSKNQ